MSNEHPRSTPPPGSGGELLQLAIHTGVMTDVRVHEFLGAHPQGGGDADPLYTAQLLADKKYTDPFRAELLLLGYPDGATLGRYRLAGLLGKGGMASVFLADDRTLRRRVALKVLRVGPDQNLVRERFAREALAAASLNHPNVVRAYDSGEHAGIPFIVMEVLHGTTLHALRAAGRLPMASVVDLGRQAAAGLSAIHAVGLLHRDLKPANVMLCEGGAVKLLDLGLARFTQAHPDDTAVKHKALTESHPSLSFLGTPQYLAPEQLTDLSSVDHRADVFGLGATLFYLVAGRAPRSGLPTDDTPPPALTSVSPGVPVGLSRLVSRMLATDPDDRPQSAAEVAQELADLNLGPESLSGAGANPARHASAFAPDEDEPTRIDSELSESRRSHGRALRTGMWVVVTLGIIALTIWVVTGR